MQKIPNPLLKKLGFSNSDKVVILHADDIGMCQATIDAYAHLDEIGAISSGAVMVPCPWFLAIVEYAQSHPWTDLGVHLTLNSEWSEYRWGPLSTRGPNSSLLDKQGFFYTYHEEPQECSKVEEVTKEITTQIEMAFNAGMHPTHVDTHMLTLFHPRFLRTYLEIAYRFGLPAMVPRYDQEEWQKTGLFTHDEATILADIVNEFEQLGFPMLDSFGGLKLAVASERLDQAKQALITLPSGIHHFYIHPSLDTPEARAISPDWQSRVADYQTFLLPELKEFLNHTGIQLIGYKAIQKWMPDQNSAH